MRFFLLVLLLAGGAAGQGEEPAPPDPAVVLNAEGVKHYEAGRFKEAAAAFRKARGLRPKEKTYARNLASALHALARERIKKGEQERALNDLERAVALDPDQVVFRIQKGDLLLRMGRRLDARIVLEKALKKWPGEAACHEAMGRLEYAEERLPEAVLFLQTASRLDPERGKRLAPFLRKVEREARVERTFLVERRGPFVVKYDDVKFKDVSQEVLEILDGHYTALAADFGHWPKRLVTVVLYTRGDFDKATGALGWAGGLFDGKIRLPVRNFRQVRTSIAATLAHELSHFFVRDITRRCPLWLDEGLAQLRQGRQAASVAPVLRKLRDAGRLVLPGKLPGSWTRVKSAEEVKRYYAVSLSFTAWLEERYGYASLVGLLEKLDGKQPFAKVFEATFSRTFREEEEDWKLSL